MRTDLVSGAGEISGYLVAILGCGQGHAGSEFGLVLASWVPGQDVLQAGSVEDLLGTAEVIPSSVDAALCEAYLDLHPLDESQTCLPDDLHLNV